MQMMPMSGGRADLEGWCCRRVCDLWRICAFLRKICRDRLPSRDLIAEDQEVQIEILGELRDAVLISEPLFDPRAERMRG